MHVRVSGVSTWRYWKMEMKEAESYKILDCLKYIEVII